MIANLFPAHFDNAQEMIKLFHARNSVPPLNVELFHHPRFRDQCPGSRNEKGYRADSFEARGDINLAFIGCSWVEGVGVVRGEIFSDQVVQLYCKSTGLITKSWNLGLSGTGIDHVVRMMPSICSALKPDFLLVVLSGFDRREYFTPSGRRHLFLKRQTKAIAEGTLKISESDAAYVNALGILSNPSNDIAYVLRNFRAMQGMLETAGIPWLFTSIENPSAAKPMTTLLELGTLPEDHYLGFVFERIDRIFEGDAHPGPKSHLQFAERTVEQLLSLNLQENDENILSNESNLNAKR